MCNTQAAVVSDFDTFQAFPEFFVEVTVLPREMQLHQSSEPSYEASNNFFLPEELEVDFEEVGEEE